MKYGNGEEVQCAYTAEGAKYTPPGKLRPLFAKKSVSGRALATRYHETVFVRSTVLLNLVTVVHVVGIPRDTGGFRPVVTQEWIDTLFKVANDIWSQACIKLVPYRTGTLVTTFRDLALLGFINCLQSSDEALLEPYDITSPETLIINVYLVEDTNGFACGDSLTGHVFLPTGFGPKFMGKVFAHEIGHVLLNPLGVDDSENPDHLMNHEETLPGETPPGSKDGLFLSDCVGAHTRAREDLFALAQPGLPNTDGDTRKCRMTPRLGNNLVVVATEG